MNRENLTQMYGATPESFKRRVAFALRKTEEGPMKRKLTVRAVLIAAAIVILLTAAAYAAFSSQVTAFFGRTYGKEMQTWLEKGDMATSGQSFTLDGVVFTVDEVVYRAQGLYGVGTIRPQEGSAVVILPEDHWPDDPYGYDIHGEGGRPEKAPAGTLTLAEVAKEKGGKLLVVRTIPDLIGVDGGAMLSPECVGYGAAPQRDGSIEFFFEVSSGYAVGEGETYTIQMWSSVVEMTPAGETLENTRHGESWTVEIKPTPISGGAEGASDEASEQPPSDALALTPDPGLPESLAEPEIIVPQAYTQTGTLPIYRATARDFSDGLRPELFNQSGIASREEWAIIFEDEAILQLSPEALFYRENSGNFDAHARAELASPGEGKELKPNFIPLPALSSAIADLASSALHGWPGDHDKVFQLEKTALTHITLDQAKERLEKLLEQLGVTGYVCDYALDMSLERIMALGSDRNAAIASGQLYTNMPQYDYSQATAADEGFYLSYHKPGDGPNLGNGDIFSAYAYVTQRGVVALSLRDMYIPGEVYDTPETLVSPQTVLDRLPQELAASRFPGKVASVSSVRLTYAPMRAPNKADGMVLSPTWLVIYQDEEAQAQGYTCWAEFNAVDGKLLNAMFQ